MSHDFSGPRAAGRGPLGLVVAALGLTVGLSSARAAGLDPTAWIPGDSVAVVQVQNPEKSLTAVEQLALAAGLAPPGAKRGWLLESFEIDVSSLDLSAPLWIGIDAPPGPDGKAVGVAVAKVRKGREKLATANFKGSGKLRIEQGWLVASNGESKPARAKKAFRFPSSSKTVQESAEVLIHVDWERVRSALGKQDGKQDGMQEILDSMGESTQAMTFGVALGAQGLSLYFQQHPNFSSPMGKMMKASKNVRGPLVTGIPNAPYGLVYGVAVDSGYNAAMVSGMRKRVEGQVVAENPEMKNLVSALFDLVSDTSGDCRQGAAGLVVPTDPQDTYFVSNSQCARAKASADAMPKLAKLVNTELRAAVAKADEVEMEGKLVHAKATTKVGDVSFSSLALEMKESADFPEFARRPILYATPDNTHFIAAWNAPPKTLKALVASSKKDARTSLTAYTATGKHLLSPRLIEGYVSVPALLSPFLQGELAPLRFAVGNLPPLALATQRQSDGSWLTQVWLPNQVAQLAAFAMQMAGASR